MAISKKEYIIILLNALENDRALAHDLKKLLVADTFDEQALDGLTDFFRQWIQTITNATAREKVKKGAAILEKIKELEKKDMLQDAHECENLENMLQHL